MSMADGRGAAARAGAGAVADGGAGSGASDGVGADAGAGARAGARTGAGADSGTGSAARAGAGRGTGTGAGAGAAISKGWNIALNAVFMVLAAIFIAPVLLVVIVSFSSQASIMANGYAFFPTEWTLGGYEFLYKDYGTVANAYAVTALVALLGTVGNLLVTSAFAYPMSRSAFKYKRAFAVFVLIPMIFSGGLTSFYLVYTTVLNLRNTLMSMVLPMLFNGFWMFVMRTYFKLNVPEAILESAHLDGASEYRIFFQIALPVSTPVLATLGFQAVLYYWNDWYNSYLFITEKSLYPVQYVMQKALREMTFFKNNLALLGAYQIKEIQNMPTETVRMAMTVVAMAPLMLAGPFFQKHFAKGMTVGSVKG
jgi:putative aldouronate transport system permease protein